MLKKLVLICIIGGLELVSMSANAAPCSDTFYPEAEWNGKLKISGPIATTGNVTAAQLNDSTFAAYISQNSCNDNWANGTVTVKYALNDNDYCFVTIVETRNSRADDSYGNCHGSLQFTGHRAVAGGIFDNSSYELSFWQG